MNVYAPPVAASIPRGALVGLVLVAGAAHAAPEWVPPAPTSAVTDEAGVLSPVVRTSLARRLSTYEARSGHQVIVWIGGSTGGVPIEQFAVAAFEAWKIGRAGLDDGLAVFAMTEDRTLRIEVGYGLEATVTDLAASSVIRNTMLPLIRRGEWDAAIVRGVESLVDTIEGRPGALPGDATGVSEPATPELGTPEKIGLFILVAFFLILLITNPRRALMLLVLLNGGGRSRGAGRGGGGGFGGGGGGFGGGGGRSGGGGASGRW